MGCTEPALGRPNELIIKAPATLSINIVLRIFQHLEKHHLMHLQLSYHNMSDSHPAILVLGGTGTVGSRLVRQLLRSDNSNTTILVASRNGNNNKITNPSDDDRVQHVPFDWTNTDTWASPFAPNTSQRLGVGAVYLIAPPGALDADRLMTEFVDFARARGARRFVLQSASSIEAGGPAMGKVHAYLRGLGQRGEVEWAVLRPTWFQGASHTFCPWALCSNEKRLREQVIDGLVQRTLPTSRCTSEASARRARSTRPRARARFPGCRLTTLLRLRPAR
jgi:hypothetical protein